MATQPIVKQARPNVKQINYLSKNFSDFRQNLIEFAKSYFPQSYADFNEASPGMMFIEMASYVGDVLSFYIDNQFKENLLAYADQDQSVIRMAQFLGYKPRLTSAASTEVILYQTAPADPSNDYEPTKKYLLKVGVGSVVSTSESTPVFFRTTELVDFEDPVDRQLTILSTDGSGNPTEWLVGKPVRVISAEQKQTTVTFGSPQKFSTVDIPDANIIGIESVVDSSNNRWYEVDFLAQDVIFDESDSMENSEVGLYPTSTIRVRKVPRRFTTRITENKRLQLLFGSGIDNLAEEVATIDSRQIATSLYGQTIQSYLSSNSVNNLNFLNTTAFGTAPANTTLTITYLVGTGINGNVPSNTITNVVRLNVQNDTSEFSTAESNILNEIISAAVVNNDIPATGGGDGETKEEMRQNALAYFNAQNRVVTAEDYVIRSYSMPGKYGHVAKAFAVKDDRLNQIINASSGTGETFVDNPIRPNTINLYVLGYDQNKKLTTLNSLVKENLVKYLAQYRMLTDEVNILDAFIVNIGVRCNILVKKNFNVNDVSARVIDVINEYFDIDKWAINEPIVLAELTNLISAVDGVKAIKDITVFDKYRFRDGLDYQEYRYPIERATEDGIIYPSLDPCIFEIKYPETDIIIGATQ